jgi:energy-coupling factor transporter ATP-binding protein EcfA2
VSAPPPPPPLFHVLGKVSGVLRPGTTTLVLAPPGHGKSALMKALTQLLPKGELRGSVTYSGLSAADAKKAGIHLGSLAQYVQQVDECVARGRGARVDRSLTPHPPSSCAGTCRSSRCARRSSLCLPTAPWTPACTASPRSRARTRRACRT